jgi:Putative restriction endonuclease
MPAGGLHGYLLAYLMELLRAPLKQRNHMLLMDVFMLYRDPQGVKRRIAPGLLFMPYRSPPPSAYDLDVEQAPRCLIEITSKESHLKDLKNNVSLYSSLGVSTYLVIDAVTPAGQPREPIELHLWRLIGERPRAQQADRDGYFILPEMGLKMIAEGQRIRLINRVTGEALCDTETLSSALEEARQSSQAAEQRARLAEMEVTRLKALLKQQ